MQDSDQSKSMIIAKLKQFSQIYQQYLSAKLAFNQHDSAIRYLNHLPERLAVLNEKRDLLVNQIKAEEAKEKQKQIQLEVDRVKGKSFSFLAFALVSTLVTSLLTRWGVNEALFIILGNYILPFAAFLYFMKRNAVLNKVLLNIQTILILVAIIGEVFLLIQIGGFSFLSYLGSFDFLHLCSILFSDFPFFFWFIWGGISFLVLYFIAKGKGKYNLNIPYQVNALKKELNSIIGEINMHESRRTQLNIEMENQRGNNLEESLQRVMSSPDFLEMQSSIPKQYWEEQLDSDFFEVLIVLIEQNRANSLNEALNLYPLLKENELLKAKIFSLSGEIDETKWKINQVQNTAEQAQRKAFSAEYEAIMAKNRASRAERKVKGLRNKILFTS